MVRQEKITNIFGTALLYTVITSTVALLRKINSAFFSQGTIVNKIVQFLKFNTPWIIVIVAIIFILSFYIKKSNQTIVTFITNNSIIGSPTGVLVVLDGVSYLVGSLPFNIFSVRSVIEATQAMSIGIDGNAQRMILQTVITNAITIAIILGEIMLGIYLIIANKRRIN